MKLLKKFNQKDLKMRKKLNSIHINFMNQFMDYWKQLINNNYKRINMAFLIGNWMLIKDKKIRKKYINGQIHKNRISIVPNQIY